MRRAAAIFAFGLVAACASVCNAKGTAQVMAGDPGGRNVTFDFGPSGLSIQTHRIGNPGAKLTIWVDASPSPLFSRLLTEEDCSYAAAGAVCSLKVEADTEDYRRFVVSFQHGATAHVEVQNASVMEMQDDVSLKGFRRQYGR